MSLNYSPILVPAVLLKRVFRKIEIGWLAAKTFVLAKLWRIQCGKNVKFAGKTIIRAYEQGAISIGNNVIFNSVATNNVVGLLNPTILCANPGGKIEIGSCSGFSSVVINSSDNVRIGSYVNVGGNVRIFDNDFHPVEWNFRRPPEQGNKTRSKPVLIDDDVFIGTNAIILKGSHIGARSVVAAGSVVFGLDVPPDSIVKGNPARVVKVLSTTISDNGACHE